MSAKGKQKITQAGPASLSAWQSGQFNRAEAMMAARYTLDYLAQTCPGKAVEVRVPPAAAIQIRPGLVHRRGQPPAVTEMSVDTWLRLATGQATWSQLVTQGEIYAFGPGSDLSDLVPLLLPSE